MKKLQGAPGASPLVFPIVFGDFPGDERTREAEEAL